MAWSVFAQQARAHQRCEGERDKSGSEDRDDNGHGKFAKDSPEQTGQKDERNKNGRERDRHRKDREGNFASAVEGGLEDGFTMLRAPNDIFQKDNRVIDQKADRQRHRHQGEIVDRVIERVHDRDREQERERERDDRDQRIGRAPEEGVDDQDDKDEGDEERRLHIVHGIDDALRPIEHRNKCDRSGQARPQLGEERLN